MRVNVALAALALLAGCCADNSGDRFGRYAVACLSSFCQESRANGVLLAKGIVGDVGNRQEMQGFRARHRYLYDFLSAERAIQALATPEVTGV